MSLFDQIAQKHYAAPPEGWRTKKIKFLADIQTSNVDKLTADDEEPVRLCNYTDVYYNDRITPDLPFMEATATPKEIEKFTLKAGQVFITKDSEGWDDIGIPALVAEDMPGVLCGYHLAIFTPDSDKLDGAFLAWLCRADALNDQFKLSANGVTRFGLGQYPMKNAVIGYPTLEAQKRIAAFLDDKTAQIDGLIARKQALLERLVEQRQAIITHAVTKGLNPAAPMKDSGIVWFGDIPEHWDVKRLNSFCDFQSGKAHEPFIDPEGEYVCVNARFISTNGVAEKRCTQNLCPAAPDDILMVMSDLPNGRALARTFLVDDRDNYAVNQRVCRIRPQRGYPTYFSYQLNRNPQLMRHDDGNEQTHLPNAAFKQLRLLEPPLAEQQEIAAYLDSALAQLDTLNAHIDRSVARLQEYRSVLITSAVTGQIGGLQ